MKKFILICTLLAMTICHSGFCDSVIKASNTLSPEKYIEIDLIKRRLDLKTANNLIKSYPIGVSKSKEFLTPPGHYKILEMDDQPGWVNPFKNGVKIPPGHNNPLGTRWMGFHKNPKLNQSYGIHGTNQPSSIGKFVSHGCVRMLIPDSEDLFKQVSIGTPVIVKYDRFASQSIEGDIALTVLEDPLKAVPLSEESVKNYLLQKYPQIVINEAAVKNLVADNILNQARLVGYLKH
jgi:hypothetical protein